MKIIVTKYLNVRLGAPSVNAPCYNYLAPGSTIEVEENTVTGDVYDDNDQWYKGLDGSYYWSGGAALPVAASPAFSTAGSALDYSKLFKNIPENIRLSKGKDVTIAVLDTGIFQAHPDLAAAFRETLYPAQNTSDSTTKDDANGHGTHVAGLIGARGTADSSITGIAPACTLQNLKVLSDDGSATGSYIENGLNKLFPKTDIVNMSLSVTYDEFQHMATIIDRVAKTSIVVCAAGGNERLLASEDNLLFPGYSQSVISVGTIDSTFIKGTPNPVFHANLDYIVPDLDLRSSSLQKDGLYKTRKGSSMAAALVSGLVALIISAGKKTNTIDLAYVKSQLDKIAVKYSAAADLNSLNLIKP